ncbi:MAG: ribonuclease Z [Crocinitomicaceae bacterium]
MHFSVTILGSGSALPTERRNPTSQYIECNGRNLLIDCGEGTQVQLRKYGIKLQRIEHVLISHLHGDHYFGLVGLLSSMHLLGRVKPINIYGPEGLKEIIELQLHYGNSRLAYELNFHTLNARSSGCFFEDDIFSLHHFPLSHKIPTIGYLVQEKERERNLRTEIAIADDIRIEYMHRLKKGEDVIDENGNVISFKKYTKAPKKPRSYAFCSDTKYYEPIIPFILNASTLYHEATFTEAFAGRAKATFHSTAIQAATIAKKAEVNKLLIGHLSARYHGGEVHIEEAKTVFENCEVVEDGSTYFI